MGLEIDTTVTSIVQAWLLKNTDENKPSLVSPDVQRLLRPGGSEPVYVKIAVQKGHDDNGNQVVC